MKENNIVTKISLEDFKKLNPIGYEVVREYHLKGIDRPVYEDEIEAERNKHLLPDGRQDLNFIRDQMEGSYHKKVWKPVDIVKEVIENLAETEVGNYVVVAIAKDPPEDEIKHEMENTYMFDGGERAHADREHAISNLRWNYCYPGRFGTTTYDLYMDIDKLYSIRNYYEYRTNDLFRIPKNITKVIYMIPKE